MSNAISNLFSSAIGGLLGGPIGAILGQLLTQTVGQMVEGLLQQLGEQLNLPQSTIDLAQSEFFEQLGDLDSAISNAQEGIHEAIMEALNPFDAVSYEDAMNNLNDLIQQLVSLMQEQANGDNGDEVESSSGGAAGSGSSSGAGEGGDGDFFIAMARALGKALQQQAEKVQELSNDLSDAVDAASGTEDNERADAQNAIMELQTLLTAESQRLSYIANGIHTALVEIGRALGTLGRTQ